MQVPMNFLINEARLVGSVYLKTGMFSAVPAVLVKTNNELVLVAAGRERFRTALHLVEKTEFPWWYFGGGMRITVGGVRYVLSFSPPARVEGADSQWIRTREEISELSTLARLNSREWRTALSGVGSV